jgi:O-antigen/teichoic acid export membrane protein
VARLLSPNEIGLFAVSFAVLLMMYGFRGLGVGAYMIQAHYLDLLTIKSAFSLVAFMGLFLSFFVNVAAFFIAQIYGSSEMEGILRILSLNFLIFPFTIMVQSKASRAHDFGWLALSELLAALVSSVVSICFVMFGYGAISLAFGAITFSTVSTVVCGVRYFELAEYGIAFGKASTLVAFGGWVTGSNVIYQVNTAIVDLVIGKVQGLSVAGLYDRAATVNRLIWEQIYPALGQVLFSSFASEKREGHDLTATYFYRLRCVLDLLWPLLIWLVVFGDYAVLFLFGDQWHDAGIIARILAFSALFSVPFTIAKELSVAMGEGKSFFKLDLWIFCCRIIVVAIAAHYSINMVAVALVLPAFLYMVFSQYMLGNVIDLSYRELLKLVFKSSVSTFLFAMILMLIRFGITATDIGHLGGVMIACILGATAMILILLIGRSPLKILVLQTLKSIVVR